MKDVAGGSGCNTPAGGLADGRRITMYEPLDTVGLKIQLLALSEKSKRW